MSNLWPERNTVPGIVTRCLGAGLASELASEPWTKERGDDRQSPIFGFRWIWVEILQINSHETWGKSFNFLSFLCEVGRIVVPLGMHVERIR